jgi:hypothetical protein
MKNEKMVLDDEDEILIRQYQLRKIAVSYWKFFAFSLSYCVIYPIFERSATVKPVYSVIASSLVAYFITQATIKYYLKVFNNKDYQTYRTFCKKYKLDDYIYI